MKGSCLCQSIAYEIEPPFKTMQYCHCSLCRKFTGSAHAANILIAASQFKWLKGQEFVGKYAFPEKKYYTTCFCKNCGSSLPWEIKGGKNIVVPAGTLDDDPGIKPQQSIFWDSRASWFVETSELPKYSEFPPKK